VSSAAKQLTAIAFVVVPQLAVDENGVERLRKEARGRRGWLQTGRQESIVKLI